jgi:hypothetical protein
MELRFFCPRCSTYNVVKNVEGQNECVCISCKKSFPVQGSGQGLSQCRLCGEGFFYNRPLFNKGLGCLILIIAAVLSIWTYGLSLVAAGFIDWILFKKLERVVACYICEGEYKGSGVAAPDFDLHLHEKYRKARENWGLTP